MKILLLLSCLLINITANAQDYERAKIVLDPVTERYMIQDTINLTNYPKGDLFKGIQSWITKSYLYNFKLGVQDSSAGLIVGRGKMINAVSDVNCSFTYEVKDNRFRFTFTDFVNAGTPYEKNSLLRKLQFRGTENVVNTTISQLKKSLISKKANSDF